MAINSISSTTFTSGMLITDTSNAAGGARGVIGGPITASTALDVQSTLGAFCPPRMTTTQRLALTPSNGMLLYDTTLNLFFVYEGGAWASIGSGTGNVVGPAVAVSGNIAVYSGTTGKLIADGGATVASLAPANATYIVQTASGALSAEQALGSLATGILKSTTTTGVVSIAVANTDYYPQSGKFVGSVTSTSASTYVVLATDYVILNSRPATGAAAVTLLTPVGITGQQIIIKDSANAANTNNITITPAAGLIDGAATKVIDTAGGFVQLVSDGSNWFSI